MEFLWLAISAGVAGAVNAVAGGGTLLTFPALNWAMGDSPEALVMANATSTMALLPGSLGGMWGYRRELAGCRRWIGLLLPASILGGAVGAGLVVWGSPVWFQRLVPWLILVASSLLLLQPMIARYTGVGRPHEEPTVQTTRWIVAFQTLVAIYGGYFGAGIGILMLSALAMMGLSDIHKMNALKSLFGTAINAIAAVLFVSQGQIEWKFAAPMAIAAVIGGFGGAVVAQRLDRRLVRWFVISVGFVLSAIYFLRP
jgi:uncharacterized protein